MARGKSTKTFRNTPFRTLKGVSVSGPSVDPPEPPPAPPAQPQEEDFQAKMAELGVEPLGAEQPPQRPPSEREEPAAEETPDEREIFLAALGSFDLTFRDEVPEPPAAPRPARRMKLLQRGRLAVEASLDLHGLPRKEALVRVGHFLDNAVFHQLQTLLIVTGRGAHSEGGPVLRTALEEYLHARSHPAVAEWSRAPRAHGGDGALVVFLRRAGG